MMTDKIVEELEVREFMRRVDSLETQMKTILDQRGEDKAQFARVDEQIRGLREQAKSHSDTQSQVSTQMNAKLDKLVSVLGADDDDHAPGEIRRDFSYLRVKRERAESAYDWWGKALVGLVVVALGSILVTGLKAYLTAPR